MQAAAAPLLRPQGKRKVPMAFAAIAEPHIAALYERKFVLVRPDGHVAWRDDRMPLDAPRLVDVVRGAAREHRPEQGPDKSGGASGRYFV